MTDGQLSTPWRRLDAARTGLRALLEQALAAGVLIPPQLRASVVQLQTAVAAEKAALRAVGAPVADAPEDGVILGGVMQIESGGGDAAGRDIDKSLNTFIFNAGQPVASASDPYAQYREYLLRLLPLSDADAAPYLGLQTFQFEHADRFFGRDRLVAELAGRLGRASFLAVLGASGSGKSSVVRAGLLPLLRAGGLPGSERWHYVMLRPGAQPLDALAAALGEACDSSLVETLRLARELVADPGALLLLARRFAPRLVLVVDQAEELWTLQPTDPDARRLWQEQQQSPFLRLLLSTCGVPDRPLLVILALRADFLPYAARDADLARAIAQDDLIISPMITDELRAVVERPAQQSGGSFEAGLVDELVAQAQGEDGALPLLEYTLQELWVQRQRDGLMTWASYRALGGVEGALAKRADSILQQHYTVAQQEEVRRVLLRLIQPGEGAADTRRRVVLADLVAANQIADEVQLLLQPLIDARLLTTGLEQGQPAAIEVSHEALIRSWPTLRGWIDEARADLRLQIQLEEAAKEWQASRGDASLLWDGLRLSNAEAWFQRAQPHLNARDAAFLAASRAEVQRQAREAARAARDRQLLAVAVPLLIMAMIASVMAIVSQRQVAAANELIDAQRLVYAAQTQRLGVPEVELLLASEAAQRKPNLITEQTLRDALVRYPFRVRILAGYTAPVESAWFSPEGTRILTASSYNATRVWSLDGTPLATLLGYNQAARSAQFSPDGTRIVTALVDGTVQVWSVEGSQLASLQGHTQAVVSAQFSPDGAYIVTASLDNTARVWKADGTPLVTLMGHTQALESAQFSPDGTRIVTASWDNTARVWKADGTPLAILVGHRRRVRSAQFSPDGTRIVTASWDNTARVWKADGTLLAVLEGHTSYVQSAQFSPDSARIVTASWDNTARVWNVDGKLLAVLQGHTQAVWSAQFSPDGARIVTASLDNTARGWSLEGIPLAVLQGHTQAVWSAQFSPDGARIVTASQDETVRVWNLDGTLVAIRQGHAQVVWNAEFSPDGTYIVTASQDKTARVWSADGTALAILQGHTAPVRSAQFSPDTSHIVTASEDKTARVWSVDGTVFVSLQGHTDDVRSAQFSSDGTRIVTASQDHTARVWSLDGTVLAILQGHAASVLSAQFSPDGILIVTASQDHTARVWSRDGTFLAALQGHTASVLSAQFSPDGTRIVTVSSDETARVWNVDGTLRATLQGHTDDVLSAQFSPDGTRIVTTSQDNTARVWSLDGTVLANLEGHTDWVLSAQFSPDGARIVTASLDNTARVWSVDGMALATLKGHIASVLSAQFSPDGARIVTASQDSTAKVYPARVEDLLAVAACRLPRNLTPEEIQRFEVGAPRFDVTKYQCNN